MHSAKSLFSSFAFFFLLYICALPVAGAVPGLTSLTGAVILIAARGYGEGGVFRELQDPPWLLPAVP